MMPIGDGASVANLQKWRTQEEKKSSSELLCCCASTQLMQFQGFQNHFAILFYSGAKASAATPRVDLLFYATRRKITMYSAETKNHTVLPKQNKLLCWEIGWCGLSWLAWILKSNFHCHIRPYLEKLFSKSLMKLGDRLMTSKSERQGLKKGQSLILCTVVNLIWDRRETS